jgi:parvulin-like peptidyl-prolyl isomerase
MRALVLMIAFLIGFAAPASADDVATAQSVIRSQEQALGHDDAATAYSYAAPAIRQLFPQADIFMFMVQNSYAPIYRHKSFEFGEARAADGRIAQRVHIIDTDGEAWEALYTLEQQPDGSLKITGCSLLKAGQAV